VRRCASVPWSTLQIQFSNNGAFLSRPACGGHDDASHHAEVASPCERVRERFKKAGLAERPPHPKPSASTSPRGEGNTASRSRRAFRASFVINVSLSETEGAGPSQEGGREDRVRAAPAVSRAKAERKTHTSIQVQRKQSGLPCAMVLRLISCSPWRPAFCHHRRCDAKHHHQLDASIGASGPHDFAVRFGAVRQKRRRVHRILPRVRDDRETPLVWDGMARNKPVIWVACEAEYFWPDDWTGLAR